MIVAFISLTTILTTCIYNKYYLKHKIKKKLKCPPKYFKNIQEYVEFVMKNKLTSKEYGTFIPFNTTKYKTFEEERKFYTTT